MIEYREIGWWYWLFTAGLLAVGLSGQPAALSLAILLCGAQVAHFALRDRSPSSFPVQVRAAYLVMLVAGLWAPLRFLHWIQLAGTTAMVTTGYCFLARVMSLMPWNRREPLTFDLLRRTFLSPPTRGCVLQGLARGGG